MKDQKYNIILFVVISILGLYSCEKTTNDPPTDVRDQYVGSWSCSESPLINYPVVIRLDSNNSTQILISNFHLLGSNAKAYAIATINNLTLPSQVISGNTFNGSGTLVNANKFTLKYYVNNLTDIDTVNATYTK
ncbi:MAG: hypothetical protein WCQ95_12360 [Bacteroidota bacterium]